LAGHFPEATWVLLPAEMGVIAEGAAAVLSKHFDRMNVLVWGPGLGTEDPTADFVRRLVERKGLPGKRGGIGFVQSTENGNVDTDAVRYPEMVIDADGLKLLALVPDWPRLLPENSVLTPHPGEMAILTGLQVDEIQSDRVEIARRFAREWGHVVVLKGALTSIAAPDGRSALIPAATSALAHAGTGDVLAGMIAGLRAQGMPGYEAAIAGAWLHAQSGMLAAEHIGHEASVLAGDLIDVLPEVISWVW
jgi:ADP-dependent NAD(P)H-hydrate dehydratase / NAD(P)H-hydrate epimerase